MTEGEKWTVDEELFLRKSWGMIPVKEIAAHLGRTNGAIDSRAARLGLRPGLAQAPVAQFPAASPRSIVKKDRSWVTRTAQRHVPTMQS